MFKLSELFIPMFYESELDRFLFDFDKNHKPTASQRKEIDKYANISRLRDRENAKVFNTNLWEKF